MNNEDYQRSIEVNATATLAYEVLTKGVEYWWTKPDKPINAIGDKVTFTFPPNQTYWVFEVKDLAERQRIEMECINAMHVHDGLPKEIEQEWKGTKMVFDITPKGNKCRIDFQHIGLRPSLLCFNICEAGWDYFFMNSLKSYLDSGKGSPHPISE